MLRLTGSTQEFVSALLVLWCAATYWLGGQELPIIHRGFKWIRRYVMPLGLACGLLLLDSSRTWQSSSLIILSTALLCAVCHLGYQTRVWKYILVGLLLGLASLPLGLTWMSILPCVFHGGFGYLSLKDNRFKWSFVALFTGASVGVVFVSAVLN